MIGRLTGKVVAQDVDGPLVLDVLGVGYELVAPLGTLGRARVDDAGRVTLWVHTHVREDVLALYGFADETERFAFRALINVSNVGPKIAVAVLGALPAAELARAIASRDLGALTAVPGVGKKVGERLLLELRDKVPTTPIASAGSGATAPPAGLVTRAGGPGERLRGALTGMGFKPGEADRAVSALEERQASRADGRGATREQGAPGASSRSGSPPPLGAHEIPFEEQLREALALLAK